MALSLENLKERLLSSWTYLDVLALAVAKAGSSKFKSDPEQWSNVIADFKTRIEAKNSNLLDGMLFRKRDPFPPYSEQMEAFFRHMIQSGALSLDSAYRVYEMPEETKADIIKQESPIFKDHLGLIEELAREIEQNLSV